MKKKVFKVKTNGSTVIKVNQSQEGTDRLGMEDGGEEVKRSQGIGCFDVVKSEWENRRAEKQL